jgi:DNA-binding response OmpR family regulator
MQATRPVVKTVLVVDDNEQILKTAAAYLRERGFVVIEAVGPFGVSALVSEHRPDVMVLDVMMSGLKGDGLLAVLRGQSAGNVPAIFYSSAEEEELYRLTRQHAGATYVQKADGLGALYQAIQTRLVLPPS